MNESALYLCLQMEKMGCYNDVPKWVFIVHAPYWYRLYNVESVEKKLGNVECICDETKDY